MRQLLICSLLAGFSSHSWAQDDAYGRSVESGLRLPSADSEKPATARPGPGSSERDGGAFYLEPYVNRLVGSWPEAVEIGDVSGHGRNDVVMTTTSYFDVDNDYRVFLFAQTVAGNLASPTKYPYGQQASRNGLSLVDLDGQNGIDVVVGGLSGLSLLRSTPSGGLAGSAPIISQQSMAIEPVDLRGIGRKDLVSIGVNSGYIHLNNGDGTVSGTPWPITLNGWNSMAGGDLNGNGREDIVVASGYDIYMFQNQLNGSLAPAGSLSGDCDGWDISGIGIGDINGDGIADIVASAGGNQPAACILVYHGTGGGGFSAAVPYASFDIPETLRVVDIDRDGRKDIVVLHGGWLAIGIYFQQSNGSLAAEVRYPLPYASHYSTEGLAIGDFSGDGCPDVAIADYNYGLVTLNGASCQDRLFASGFEAVP